MEGLIKHIYICFFQFSRMDLNEIISPMLIQLRLNYLVVFYFFITDCMKCKKYAVFLNIEIHLV